MFGFATVSHISMFVNVKLGINPKSILNRIGKSAKTKNQHRFGEISGVQINQFCMRLTHFFIGDKFVGNDFYHIFAPYHSPTDVFQSM